jgi:hypothetical protein
MNIFNYFPSLLICTLLFGFFGCQSKTTETAANATLETPKFPDTIFMDIDSTGKMHLGTKEISDTEELKKMLLDSCRNIKKQGGKMPILEYHTHGDVLMGTRGALKDIFLEVEQEIK